VINGLIKEAYKRVVPICLIVQDKENDIQ